MWVRLLLLVCFVLTVNAMHFLHIHQIRRLPFNKDQFDALYLPDPAFLQFTSLGNETLLADFIWLETIQYYGDRLGKAQATPFLYRYFDAITTLDPDFIGAYIFASYVMGYEPELREDAVKILKKGMELNPTVWGLPYQMGMMYHLYFKEPEKAAVYFEQASRLPHAPVVTKNLAAQLYRKADTLGACMVSLHLWSENVKQAGEKHVKDKAERNFIETAITCDLIRIRQAIEAFHKRRLGAPVKPTPAPLVYSRRFRRYLPGPSKPPVALSPFPASLEELVQLGLLPKLPQDFFKRPYLYDSRTGRVMVQPLPWQAIDLKLRESIAMPKKTSG
ncbi:MAG: tetratricopeptide repeat protein [Candidatus Sericytochromatia bacterium]